MGRFAITGRWFGPWQAVWKRPTVGTFLLMVTSIVPGRRWLRHGWQNEELAGQYRREGCTEHGDEPASDSALTAVASRFYLRFTRRCLTLTDDRLLRSEDKWVQDGGEAEKLGQLRDSALVDAVGGVSSWRVDLTGIASYRALATNPQVQQSPLA